MMKNKAKAILTFFFRSVYVLLKTLTFPNGINITGLGAKCFCCWYW